MFIILSESPFLVLGTTFLSAHKFLHLEILPIHQNYNSTTQLIKLGYMEK